MGIFIACALVLSSVQCATTCILESCKPAPQCHQHSAPAKQAPCGHEVIVAVADQTPAAQGFVANAPIPLLPAGWMTGGAPLLSDATTAQAPSPTGLTASSSLVLRI